MEITKASLEQWLTTYNRTRDWLAERLTELCGTNVSRRTVDNWLRSPRPIPKSKIPIIAALIQEDHERTITNTQDLQMLKLRFTDEQFDIIEQAALREHKTIRTWMVDTLNQAATDTIADKIQPPPAQPWEAQHHPQVIANIRQQLNQMAEDVGGDDRAVN